VESPVPSSSKQHSSDLAEKISPLRTLEKTPEVILSPTEVFIKGVVVSMTSRFDQFLESGQAKEVIPPFTIRTDLQSKQKTLFLPKNINAYSDNPAIAGLIKLSVILNYKLDVTDSTAVLSRADQESNLFWRAYYREAFTDTPPERLVFKGGSAAEKGTAAARMNIVKSYLKTLNRTHLYTFLSPALFTEAGNKKVEYLSLYLSRLAGGGPNPNAIQIEAAARTLLSDFADSRLEIWKPLVENHKIPLSEAMKDLHRRKEHKVKGKTEVRTLTPNRPSGRAEVLFTFERRILEQDEKNSFDLYKKLITELEHQDGVPIQKLEETRKEISSLISLMWQTIQRYSATLTTRGKLLSRLVRDYEVGSMRPSRENYLLLLSSLPIIIKNSGELYRILKDLKLFQILAGAPGVEGVEKAALYAFNWHRDGALINLIGVIPETIIDEINEVLTVVGGCLTAANAVKVPNVPGAFQTAENSFNILEGEASS